MVLLGKIYQAGLRVRIEPNDSKEVDLYDFEARTHMRVFPADRIYFTSALSDAKIIKASLEGWIPPPARFRVSKTFLREGQFKDGAGRLYFYQYKKKGGNLYALRWVTADREERLLRIIYPGSANETIIVDYDRIKTTKLSSDYFRPPADFLSLNPF
ncbi:MAG: hypothetical protein ACE5GK_05335 [Nitrospiria bacterium]